MTAAGEGIAGLCWSQYLSSQETEPQLIEQTAHIWGGSFYLCLPSPENPFYSCTQFVINLPVYTKQRRKSQGRGSFCFEHTRNNGLTILAKAWWQASAGSGEQGMGTVVAHGGWRPQACVLSSPLQEPHQGRLGLAA